MSVTVTDQSNNQTTKTAVVTVRDTISPELTLSDITVYLKSNGTVSITPSDLVTSASDNCIVADTVYMSKHLSICSDIGNNTVMCNVTDQSKNQITKTAVVTGTRYDISRTLL